MKSIWMVIVSELHLNRGQVVSLFIIAIIAGMMLNLSLLLMLRFDDFFAERTEATNAPHFLLIESIKSFSDQQIEYLENYPGTEATEHEDGVWMAANVQFNDRDAAIYLLFLNANVSREMNDLRLIEGERPMAVDEICVPYVFKTGGYELGDEFLAKRPNGEYHYRICGFTEEIMLGSIYNQNYQIYMCEQGFRNLRADTGLSHKVVRVRLDKAERSEELSRDFNKQFFFVGSTSNWLGDLNNADDGTKGDASGAVVGGDNADGTDGGGGDPGEGTGGDAGAVDGSGGDSGAGDSGTDGMGDPDTDGIDPSDPDGITSNNGDIFVSSNYGGDDVLTGGTGNLSSNVVASEADGTNSNGLAVTLSVDWSRAKLGRTYMSTITSAVLFMFAALIMIIGLLVIRYKVYNSIEENLVNIGALKTIGYTGGQLMLATVSLFTVVALAGFIIGALATYTLLPLVSQILEQQTALQWHQGFDLSCFAITVTSLTILVLLVSWLSSRKLNRLTVLSAFRQGLSTHSFKKNHFSLEGARSPLTWLLALKELVSSKRQMVMVFVIVTALGYVAVASLAVYDNLGVRSQNFAHVLFGEVPDAVFFASTVENAEELRGILEQDPEVRKTVYAQDLTVMIADTQVTNRVVEDFDLLEGTLLYKGRYPKHDNEICLAGSLSELTELKIGDTARVSQGAITREYLIVGLIQTVVNDGLACTMTSEAFTRIQPKYQPYQMSVYLYDGDNSAQFVERIKEEQKTLLATASDYKTSLEAQLVTYSNIFWWLALVLLLVTIVMIFLMLYLMLNTAIVRKMKELGIQKALGFTSFRMMNQQALHFMPAVVLGVIAGAIVGVLAFNPVFVMITRSMGIVTTSMPSPIMITIVACVAMVILAYLFALFITLRIRRITAYALITE